VAVYLRVSTSGQTLATQKRDLSDAARRHGWKVVAIYSDKASGKSARRPGYDELMAGVGRRRFDMVAAWSVDRLGRSLHQLVAFLGELRAKSVDLYLHAQGIDTSTPGGAAMFQMLGVFAEFERAIIVERVKAGQARARAEGRSLGRPKVDGKRDAIARTLISSGAGIIKAAKAAGVGVSVAQRIARELR
jgi:DNA invertase Pin-like site-specific DNA recombinase